MNTELELMELGDGLKFYYRPDTTDEKVIPEVIKRRNYFRSGFLEPEPSDIWADLGGNIGTFSVMVATIGCRVVAYEPEPENLTLLIKNLLLNDCFDQVEVTSAGVTALGGDKILFLSKGLNKYRHTLVRPIKGRSTISVETIAFQDIIDRGVTAIKMDIEGAELEIFDCTENWGKVNKLSFEYHFDFDKSIYNFYKRIGKLKKHFKDVYYGKMPQNKVTYDYFPAARTVFCVKRN